MWCAKNADTTATGFGSRLLPEAVIPYTLTYVYWSLSVWEARSFRPSETQLAPIYLRDTERKRWIIYGEAVPGREMDRSAGMPACTKHWLHSSKGWTKWSSRYSCRTVTPCRAWPVPGIREVCTCQGGVHSDTGDRLSWSLDRAYLHIQIYPSSIIRLLVTNLICHSTF